MSTTIFTNRVTGRGFAWIENPGTEPVAEFGGDVSEANACASMGALVADLATRGVTVASVSRDESADEDGRYGFTLTADDRRVIPVRMPGLPVTQVRYLGEPGQNIWDFPRLYVGPRSLGVGVRPERHSNLG